MKKLTLLLIVTFITVNAFSAYLRNVPVELKQPDGSVIQCFVTGDEFHRRLHDKDNYTIIQNSETGNYVYALNKGDELIPSEYVVGKSDPKQLQIEPYLDKSVQRQEEKRLEMIKSAELTTTAPTKGNLYNLVVFVRFADDEEFTLKSEDFNSLYNDTDSDASSVFGFYNKSSGGQLKVYSKFYPIPQNEKIMSYKDYYTRNYYSPYSISNTLGYKNENERNEREHYLVKNAVNFIKAGIPSSEIIDGNNDGFIDNITIIIKGSFDYWSDLLWPHMSYSNSNDIFINDKSIVTYNIQIENFIISEGVRVLCHELFHSLGAPDLYRYGSDSYIDPVGIWDIMGSYDGQYLTAYMKWKYGKWFDNLPEITQPGIYTLQPISKNPFSCYKIPSPNSSTEYFMTEYREGVGLIIYRINSLAQGNAAGPPDEMYVYRPSGNLNVNGLLFEAAFSKQNDRVLFNSESNPSCFLTNGQSGQIDISNIGSAENEISFNFNTFNPLPQPRKFNGELQNNQVVFNWNSPEKKGYLLLGYNIFIGESNTPLNNTIITDTTYTTVRPEIEATYLYKLTAKYIEGTSSPISTSISNIHYNLGDKKWINYTSGNIIQDIAQEGDYLWLAGGGLSKFNTITGENLNFNHANSGLPANDAMAVKVDKYGNKWIGMYSGDLVKFDDNNWITFKTPFPEYEVMDIVIDSKNLIWIASWSKGILSFDGNNWKTYNTSNSNLPNDYVWCLNVDSLDNIWVGTNSNLVKFDGTNWTNYNSDNWTFNDSNYSGLPGYAVSSIEIDKDGNKWIGTNGGGLVKFDGSSWIRTGLADGMQVDAISIDDENNKWVGCLNCDQLFKVNDDGIQAYDRPGGIMSIVVDQNNNKWIGTFGNGLMKFDENNWTQYKTGNSGLTSDRMWSIYFHKDGTRWMGTEQNGIVSFNGNEWKSFDLANPLFRSLPGVNQITGDNQGNIWYATEQGVAKYDGQNLEFYNPQNSSLPDYIVYDIIVDKNGIKWFGTNNGLATFDGLTWKIYNTTNLNLLSNQISALNVDKENNLWIGYKNVGGVSKFNGVGCINFLNGVNGPATSNTSDLFFDNEENLWVSGRLCSIVSKYNGFLWTHYNNLFNVSIVRQDSNNQLWFGGYYRGIITLKNSQWITYDIYNSGIPSNMVTTLEIDSLGNKWIGTYGGGLAVFNENGIVQPPIAKAGIDQIINERELVTLNGSNSSDPDGTQLTYKWKAPAGITLSSTTEANPTFTAPDVARDTTYTFSLVVRDGKVDSQPDSVNILIKNIDLTQTINFNVGWNVFSFPVITDSSNIKYNFQPLIIKESLIKIQDETGNSLEDWGIFGSWKDNIGEVHLSEGYKTKVSRNDSLEICGTPVEYPFAIPLKSGWNIMGYPQTAAYDGLVVLQQLIDGGKLIKAQDEAGNSIEDWGIYGGWKNNIYDFVPGKGYNIKLSADDTLWINESYPKSSAILPEIVATTHFKPASEGNGLDHMNINMVNLPVNVLQSGDELAVFDGTTCVGAITVVSHHLLNQTASIAVSGKDYQGMPGFTAGNPITLKLWNSKQNTEFILEPEIVKGTSTFAKNETTVASLEKYTATGLDGIAGNGLTEINCYPNPFRNEVTVEIKLSKDSEVEVEVLNQLGQRIRFLQTSKMLNSGVHRLMWDGRNAGNGEVSPGIYHLRIGIDNREIQKKIVLSK